MCLALKGVATPIRRTSSRMPGPTKKAACGKHGGGGWYIMNQQIDSYRLL